jgi:hypothetical protein
MALKKIPRRMLVPDLTTGDVTLTGADPTGATNSTTAIQAMAAATGFVLFPAGNYLVTTLTIDCPVHFEPGAYLSVAATHTCTITGTITSSRQWIFRGDGLVVLSHDGDGGENARQVHVSWFGAFGSASATTPDQGPAIQRALTAMGNGRESELLFDFGNYNLNSAMVLTRGAHIKGSGTRRTVFRTELDGFDLFTTGNVACKFSDIQFELNTAVLSARTGGYCIRISHGECEVYNVDFVGMLGVVTTANNTRIDNLRGAFGSYLGAGSAMVWVAGGSGARVSNIQAGTSTFGPEALVRVGGTGGAIVSGFSIENIYHIAPAASVHVEAFAGDVVRGTIGNVVYNGSGGTAPTYGMKFATSGATDLSDILVSGVVIGSYATNGILLDQASSGTMEDITFDNVDIHGSSGIGMQFTRTAGVLQGIKVGDTCDVSERATPYGHTGSTTILQARISPMAIPNAGPAVSWTWNLADDTVQVINLERSIFTGVGILSCAGTHYGMFVVRAASSPAVTAMITSSASVNSTTGVLAGTTGTDTKLTLSAVDKVIYIENRLGSSQAVHFTLLTGL